jgi:SAM-dependent methyltransferase
VTQVFCPDYADAYDTLYREKDYPGECDRLERVFAECGQGATRRLLDLGCGTGSHALLLAQRGYEVVGVDRSEAMIARARDKAHAPALGAGVTFALGDVRDVACPGSFDAVLLMFAVLSYQLTNADVVATLRTARRHLRPGGLLVGDVWYGPAVLSQRPARAFKSCPLPDGELLRTSLGTLNSSRQTCDVSFNIWRLQGDRLIARTEEHHTVRYFHPMELELLLEQADLELVRLGAFPEYEREADETTWNAMLVARAPAR